MAARQGHLATLRWMREEADPPCPWDPQQLLDNVDVTDEGVIDFIVTSMAAAAAAAAGGGE